MKGVFIVKKKLTLIVAIAIAVGAVSLGVMARGWGRGINCSPGQGKYGKNMFNIKALNLTMDQQQKLLSIRQDFEKDTMNLRFEIQKKNVELKQLWAAKPLNQKAIEAKSKEIAGLRVQITNRTQTMQEQIKKILTKEQLDQWNNKKRQRGQNKNVFKEHRKFAGNLPFKGQGRCGGNMPFGGQGKLVGKMSFGKDLDLTPEQQLKILDIRRDFEKDTMTLRFEMERKNLELQQLWAAEPLDQKAIETKTQEIAGLRVQLTNKSQTMQEQMKKVLTEEQLKKLDEKKPDHLRGKGKRGWR